MYPARRRKLISLKYSKYALYGKSLVFSEGENKLTSMETERNVSRLERGGKFFESEFLDQIRIKYIFPIIVDVCIDGAGRKVIY